MQLSGALETSPTPVTIAENSNQAVDLSVNVTGNIQLTFARSDNVIRVATYAFNNFAVSSALATAASPAQAVRNLTRSTNGLTIAFEPNISLVNNQPLNAQTVILSFSGGSWTTSQTLRSVGLASEWFDGKLILSYESALQPTYFIYDNRISKFTGKIASLYAGGSAGSTGVVGQPSFAYVDGHLPRFESTNSRIILPVKGELQSNNGSIYSLRNLALVEVKQGQPVGALEISDSLFIPGSLVSQFDGQNVFEQGFSVFPEGVTASVGGSGSAPNGTYGWAVTYAFDDAQGVRWESAPFFGSSNLTGTNSTITLTIPNLRITNKPNSVEIVVYRTKANSTIYYRDNATSSASPVFSSVSSDNQNVVVTIPSTDTAIESNPLLYTTGGVQSNAQAPSCLYLTEYRNRIFYSGLENSSQIAFSKYVRAKIAAESVASYVLDVPGKADEAVSFAKALDDKLIIFKPTALFALTGDGPLDTGLQNDFSAPVAIQTDVGCSNPLSVVSGPQSVLFQSKKGIFELTRGLQVNFVGDAVKDFNSAIVTSAQLLDNANEIRFSLDSGKTLVYNYEFKQWGSHSGLGVVQSAITKQNVYHKITSAGKVYRETEGLYSDAGSYIQSKITTGWLIAAGVQGLQRVYRFLILGGLEGQHFLRVNVGYDYQNSFAEAFTFSSESVFPIRPYGSDTYGVGLFGGSFNGVYQFEILPSVQKCQSVRLQFVDSQDVGGSFSAGFSLSAITALVGVKGPVVKGATRIS